MPLEGLAQVDEVDPVALTEDEALHLRVPSPRLVAEVDSGLQQLPHGDDGHKIVPPVGCSPGRSAAREEATVDRARWCWSVLPPTRLVGRAMLAAQRGPSPASGPAGGSPRRPSAAAPCSRACRPASWPGWRAPAAPGRPAGRRPRRGGGWRRCGAGRGGGWARRPARSRMRRTSRGPRRAPAPVHEDRLGRPVHLVPPVLEPRPQRVGGRVVDRAPGAACPPCPARSPCGRAGRRPRGRGRTAPRPAARPRRAARARPGRAGPPPRPPARRAGSHLPARQHAGQAPAAGRGAQGPGRVGADATLPEQPGEVAAQCSRLAGDGGPGEASACPARPGNAAGAGGRRPAGSVDAAAGPSSRRRPSTSADVGRAGRGARPPARRRSRAGPSRTPRNDNGTARTRPPWALTSPGEPRGVRWRSGKWRIHGLEIRSAHAARRRGGRRSGLRRGIRPRTRTGTASPVATTNGPGRNGVSKATPKKGGSLDLRRRRRGAGLRPHPGPLRRGRRHVRPHGLRPPDHRPGQRRLGALPGRVGRAQLVLHHVDDHACGPTSSSTTARRATAPRW